MAKHELTQQQKQQVATALGLDVNKIDWANVFAKAAALVQFLLTLFGQPTPMQAPPPAARSGMKAAGCPDEDLDHCCDCHAAGLLALQAAVISFGCCEDCCTPKP
jgi:hypothetical protein